MAGPSSPGRREAGRLPRAWGRRVPLLAVFFLVACRPDGRDEESEWTSSHASLEAAERAFAARSLSSGVRDAFLAYLAPDGVIFQPGPVRGHEFWEAQPEVDGTLWWAPRIVEVARSGELGYTTGPYRFRAGDRTGHGWYSSVWRRDGADSAWRVVVDLGTRNTPPDTTPRPAVHIPWHGVASGEEGASHAQTVARLLTTDDAFSDSLTAAPAAGYRHYGSVRLRVHRDGRPPLSDADSVAAWLEMLEPAAAIERAGHGVARSADLAYTYGVRRGPERDLGWLRVWRRDAESGWRLVLDVASPMPGGG